MNETQAETLETLKAINLKVTNFNAYSTARWSNHKQVQKLVKEMAELKTLLNLAYGRIIKLKAKMGLPSSVDDD
jgi:hypothetical protein